MHTACSPSRARHQHRPTRPRTAVAPRTRRALMRAGLGRAGGPATHRRGAGAHPLVPLGHPRGLPHLGVLELDLHPHQKPPRAARLAQHGVQVGQGAARLAAVVLGAVVVLVAAACAGAAGVGADVAHEEERAAGHGAGGGGAARGGRLLVGVAGQVHGLRARGRGRLCEAARRAVGCGWIYPGEGGVRTTSLPRAATLAMMPGSSSRSAAAAWPRPPPVGDGGAVPCGVAAPARPSGAAFEGPAPSSPTDRDFLARDAAGGASGASVVKMSALRLGGACGCPTPASPSPSTRI
jgi:hypothetical protein